jgi:glutamyl-Q tRNA(Asp) synthetase
MTAPTGRFAPSPTGWLHLGHAFSAITAHDRARAAGGRFLLRIEDTDRTRCRPAFEEAIHDDLHWLGLTWDGPVLRQSDDPAPYDAALAQLAAMDLTYPCRCTRSDIAAALSAPQEGAALPPVYPGTCRSRPMSDRATGDAIRLNLDRALASLAALPAFIEAGPAHAGTHRLDPARLRVKHGDIVLSRRDIGPAYHLTVVVDDARQHITDVTRGEDLFAATDLHVLLQTLLGLPTPGYYHHRLIRDDQGRRLAKRDDARAMRRYRTEGATPADIRCLLAL